MTPEDRFRLLAGVALVDGRFEPAEERLLLRCARWLGVAPGRAGALLEELARAGGVRGLSLPPDAEERRRLFRGVVWVVAADGRVTVPEQSLLLRLAPHFGVDAPEVGKLLSEALCAVSRADELPAGWRRPTGLRSPPPRPRRTTRRLLGPGTVLAGRFRVEEVIGRGGFGTVYRARHLDLGEDVALKILSRRVASDDAARERFLAEVKACRSFAHRYAVAVREFGRDRAHELLYFSMDLVRGRTLGDLLAADGPQPAERLVPLFAQALEALAEAHRVGIVHSDLKADNLMLTRGPEGDEEIRVLDFGIARAVERAGSTSSGELTAGGEVVGTLATMSPEQAQGLPLDGRSDIYSLAVVLCRALTGRLPYGRHLEASDTKIAVLYHIINAPPRTLDEADGLPPALRQVLRRCLAKSPAERYPSADAARAALLEAMRSPEPEPLRAPISRWFRRWVDPGRSP